jgi:adenine phosphoribosyltransferase
VDAANAERTRKVGLCASCRFAQIVRSSRGAEFWLCELSRQQKEFRKYPVLPVLRCLGYASVMTDLARYVVDVPDFPQPGILFRDISVLLRERFTETIDALEQLFDSEAWAEIDAVAGVESRGFILAAALAERQGKGFVPIRKRGKLPPPVLELAYDLEYGTGVLEMKSGQGKLLIVDDVLATGGTLRAAADLAELAGYRIQALGVLIQLGLCRDFTWRSLLARSVIQYG